LSCFNFKICHILLIIEIESNYCQVQKP
jgi:hypothetical protein